MTRTLRLHAEDDVAIAVDRLPAGHVAEGVTTGAIPRGHKFALRPIAAGEPVRKYGQIIGEATAEIAPGAHVHTQNLGMAAGPRSYRFGEAQPLTPAAPETFEGFRRDNGKVGTRNYLGVLTTVNCSATVARRIASEATRRGLTDGYPNVDGIVALTHNTGCGMADSGDGYDALERTLFGYAMHPNFHAVLIVGLGCEMLQIARLKQAYGLKETARFRSFTIQGEGGTRATVERGLAYLSEMLPEANTARREPVPASELIIGLQCGGSDGYSGLTANPALGVASDLLVAQGGTTILSETPEIYGAEHLLTARATEEVGEALLDRIRWWEDYTARNKGEMNNNPSPGNKAGGLTTILEKSLGAVAKGGAAPLSAVYRYAEPITTRGFTYMDSPGYDPASVTGQIASGANLVCFTTGRGSAAGYKPVPSIKLATNSEMFARMQEDMDINCGDVIDGRPLGEMGREIFDNILATASGEPTKSETLDYGDNEFVPWQIGAVM